MRTSPEPNPDDPDSEKPLPLFPKGRAYDLFLLSLVLEIFLIGLLVVLPLPNPVANGAACIVLVGTFGLATIPSFIYPREPRITRARYAMTGCMMWVLFTMASIILFSLAFFLTRGTIH